MAKDLTVVLDNRPGTLADLGEALGEAGINLDAMCAFPCEGKGVIHILVEDAGKARSALENAGLTVESERDVLLFEAEDRPGMLGETMRKLADAGVNVDLLYKATQTKLVIGADDLEKAQATL
ncbi:MAG: amino acid-binding protein [Chloroflexi bacterium]|nr:amino acid-binding protein [Chloroflexota bacterium]